MEGVSIANKRLRTVCGAYERDFNAQIAELDKKENILKERLNELDKKKLETARENGNEDVSGDDLVEVNAGGTIVAAKRSALTQLGGTRFEALFSGRWDKKLQRDSDGRIFLDVNPVGFRALVDYLHELAISSEDDPPNPPSVNDEQKHILSHQLELFGLCVTNMPDSNILKTVEKVNCLHDWLEEDGSDGEFNLLYRSSRDGGSNSSFHSKCDNKGRTLTIIETADGFVFGGYSNMAWTNHSGGVFRGADKAFLFVLWGGDVSSPYKMKLKNPNDEKAVYHSSNSGPVFGRANDLYVAGANVNLKFGNAYELGPSGQLTKNGVGSNTTFVIKEIEVFEVSGASSRAAIATTKAQEAEVPQATPVSRFTEDVNEVINAKQESLLQAEVGIRLLEDSFKDEHQFISTFTSGDQKDVVTLNVSGSCVATKRSTLQTIEESVLAQQFDDSKWIRQGLNSSRVKEWTPDDVCAWGKAIEGIQEDVGGILKENKINGCELLTLNMEGLKLLGIKRPGTFCLLLEEIKALKQSSDKTVTLIEHSPYCFGKILDFLRMKQLHKQGLSEEPTLPIVCDSQKSRFEKVVRYYFPGEGAKIILG